MVKQGYKETEIGVIPEDWETRSFDKCFKVLSNNTLSRAELNDNCGTVKNIHYGDILIKYKSVLDCSTTNIPFINNPDKGTSNMLLMNGDVIIADTAEDETVGKAVEISELNNQQIISGLHTIPCRAINPEDFANGYLGYYINCNVYHSQLLPLITGTKVSSISKSTIADTIILIPPFPEQKRIAEALSDVDSMIISLEKLIAKKKAIKQGAMQELLTGKKRLDGFTGEWTVEQLGNVSRIKTGDKNNEQKVENGKYSFFVRSQQVERINTYSFDGEAILVPGEGNIGQIFHYINGKFDWHQRVYKISNFPDGVCGKYVYYQMKYCFGEHALRNTVKATVDSLRLPTFKSFTFFLPPSFDEQVAIASILFDMDEEIEALEQELAKTLQIKQGIMQQLLTGKIRLAAEEKATVAIPVTEQTDLPHSRSGHNQQFDDAVMIAAIVNAFYSEKYPLGRKKVQKLLYLLRRKQEEDTSAFKKKAAGPYADEVRYKGGEPIARKQGYIATVTTQKGTAFSKGQAIDLALSYVAKWQMQSDIDWLVSTFKYTKTNDLELYATIDMAICDLQHEGISVSVDSVKDLIRSNEEWKAKLAKTYFSDEDIARAIVMCKRLYS